MTEYLYQSDSYLSEFDARVTAHSDDLKAVELDRSALYPGGGGQPHDLGSIGGHRVTGVRRSAGGALYLLEGELPPAGSSVHCQVDWQRRYALMRTHTAMHVLCGVVFRDYGAQVTGGEMELLKGRMDFEFARMDHSLVTTIEAAVNKEISAAREVRVAFLPRAQAFQIPDLIRTKINLLPPGIPTVRTVEIVGLDLQADGGTHVRNTSEVGKVRVTDYKSKGAINKRIYVEIG